MHAEKRSASNDSDVRGSVLDQGHEALAQLVEKVGSVCRHSLAPECDCDECPEGKSELCCDSLVELGQEIMMRMLEHFHHEEDLMKALPRNQSTREHCQAHRREHVHFSTRYNQSVVSINNRHPATRLKALDTFISDWVRSHVLEYDLKLDTLLKAHASGR